jgi:hypothetical protein
MAARLLKTAEDVIAALGGATATARLTGRKPQHVWNWKNTGRLPADTFLIVSEELKSSGKSAPPALWGIAEPQSAGKPQ